MECFCGCGTKVPSRALTDLNLKAGEMAIELLAWDKARWEGRISGEDSERVESLIARGSNAYQRMLLSLHGERESTSTEESTEWMAESLAERRNRRSMTEPGSILRREKLLLNEDDFAALNRVHPETSFTGGTLPPPPPHPGGAAAPATVDVAGQLERLGALHAEGVLSDEEFAAAKARVLG